MLGVLWNLLQSFKKPIVVTLLLWRLAAWGVPPGDKGKQEKPTTHDACGKGDPTRRKRSDRGSGKCMVPGSVRSPPSGLEPVFA